MVRGISVVVLAGLVAACGGKATTEADGPSTGGSTSTGGSSAGGSSAGGSTAVGGNAGGGAAGVGGSTGVGGGGGGDCVPQGDGWSTNSDPACVDLSVLAVTDPTLSTDDGDGMVSPGEAFDLQVRLSEVKGIGFSMYPGVKFESDHPGVTIKENDWYYGIFACASYDAGAQGKVDASVPHGTVVKLTARAAMLNTDCPNAPSLTFELTVK